MIRTAGLSRQVTESDSIFLSALEIARNAESDELDDITDKAHITMTRACLSRRNGPKGNRHVLRWAIIYSLTTFIETYSKIIYMMIFSAASAARTPHFHAADHCNRAYTYHRLARHLPACRKLFAKAPAVFRTRNYTEPSFADFFEIAFNCFAVCSFCLARNSFATYRTSAIALSTALSICLSVILISALYPSPSTICG
jgi:hypothetical protein